MSNVKPEKHKHSKRDLHQESVYDYTLQQPYITYAFGQNLLKGEDYCLIETNVEFPSKASFKKPDKDPIKHQIEPVNLGNNSMASVPEQSRQFQTFDLYAIMDGHNGKKCAEFIKSNILKMILKYLPRGPPPRQDLRPAEFSQFIQKISKGMAKAFFKLEYDFSEDGDYSGSTLTALLRYGWYLTIASVGDSKCVMDSKAQILEVTNDHRFLQNNQETQRVLQVPGTIVAKINPISMQPCQDDEEGVGPERVWPGGLALSRTIGDFDAGKALICSPQIVQVQIPSDGSRIILCSDGVWDYWNTSKMVTNFIRRHDTVSAVQKLVKVSASRQGENRKDDITVLIVDITSRQQEKSQELQQKQRALNRSIKAQSFPCFSLFHKRNKPKFAQLDDSVRTHASRSYHNSDNTSSGGEEGEQVFKLIPQNLEGPDLINQLAQAPLIIHFIDIAVLQHLTKGLTIHSWHDQELVQELILMQEAALLTWQENKNESEPQVFAGQNFSNSEKTQYKNHYNVYSLKDLKQIEQEKEKVEQMNNKQGLELNNNGSQQENKSAGGHNGIYNSNNDGNNDGDNDGDNDGSNNEQSSNTIKNMGDNLSNISEEFSYKHLQQLSQKDRLQRIADSDRLRSSFDVADEKLSLRNNRRSFNVSD